MMESFGMAVGLRSSETAAVGRDTLDYSRWGGDVSLAELRSHRMRLGFVGCCAAGLLLLPSVGAEGQVTVKAKKPSQADPVLRSVAVLEWVGEPGKPSASRLMPVTVYDGEQLNDGTIYMTKPEPLGLAGGTEYELQMAGKPSGLFDVFGAGDINGSWQGFGVWKPLSKADAERAAGTLNTSSLYAPVDSPEDDKPVLKRKHPKGTDGDEPASKSADADSGKKSSDSSASTASSDSGDPDRPKLKRKGSGDSASSDPDRPTLKRKNSDDTAAGGDTDSKSTNDSTGKVNDDPDRPTIRRARHSASADEGERSNVAPDPDRPVLKRGKPADLGGDEPTRLMGYPPSMQQVVAVSDVRAKPDHSWKYSWANPEDELKMKAAMEAVARTALGLDAPAAPVKPARKAAAGTAARRSLKPAAKPVPFEPVALADEHFRVFELTYGSSATMVLTASSPLPDLPGAADTAPAIAGKGDPSTDADPNRPVVKYGKPKVAAAAPAAPAKTAMASGKPAPAPAKPAPQKFVTLIGQPDLYGGLQIVYKNVTDASRLDEAPRMFLVDAVDALGDNRGELLFELRGATQRQFAMFRVMRGTAEQLFATLAIPTDGSRAER